MVSAPILLFSDWGKTFHVHVDASGIALCNVLVQPREGNMDHPVYFAASRKLSRAEHNYMTTKRDGLAMVYSFQKFCHYPLSWPPIEVIQRSFGIQILGK